MREVLRVVATAFAKRFSQAGWISSAASAVESVTSADGTYGGALAAVRSHICSSPLPSDTLVTPHLALSAQVDVSGRVLHMAGSDVLLLAGYARHGDVSTLMSRVAELTNNGRLPFILLGDFNRDFEELREAPWWAMLGAKLVRPSGGSVSCHQGQGSLIDLCVHSVELTGYIESLQYLTTVPWGPHDSIELVLRTHPKAATVRVLAKPPGRLWPDAKKEVASPLAWSAAREAAQAEPQTSGEFTASPEPAVAAAASMGFSSEAERHTRDL